MVTEHIPNESKRGVIVTLPKPGKSNYNVRESYRGITLLSALYKLFETVALNRIKQAASVYNLRLCHPLQNAYQQHVCSIMTSFTLQETVNHFIERGSKVYCCMLDAASAFDHVWQDGLFYKLFNVGINGRLWRVLRSAYSNVRSCVSFDGILSRWFDVRQSVRQGGVLSAWLYVIFINALPDTLENNNVGAFIGSDFYGCPMQADDVALVALTKDDLNKMMTISYDYSRKWRYRLNPSKTVILVFGESPSEHKRLSKSRDWKLGNESVLELDEHKHVGVMLSTSFKHTKRTLNATIKLRKTFFSIVGAGINPSNTCPLTTLRLFKSVCIPRALYGCELWTCLSSTDLQMLEVTFRFCVKYMQGFPKRTRTAISLASLGVTNIEHVIDKCKLLFLRRLCVAPLKSRVKSLFLKRLIFFKHSVSARKIGFVSDIYRLLQKYSLIYYIEQFISEGYFPPKYIWRRIIDCSIKRHSSDQWSAIVTNDPEYERFVTIHNDCTKPLVLWKVAARFPHKLSQLKFLTRITAMTYSVTSCKLCKNVCSNFIEHYFCQCQKMNVNRENFWNFVSNNYSVELEVELHNLSDGNFANILLGGNISFFNELPDEHLSFLKKSACIWYPS